MMSKIPLRPAHLALFFCDRALFEYSKNDLGPSHNELFLWCLRHTAFFHLIPLSFSVASNRAMRLSMIPLNCPSDADEGKKLIFDFLLESWICGGEELFNTLRNILAEYFISLFDTQSRDISLFKLHELFFSGSTVDMETVKMADNSFSRFRAWVLHSWTCIGFDTQIFLASHIHEWWREVFISGFSGHTWIKPKPKRNIKRKGINIKELHTSLQNVFEGCGSFAHFFSQSFLSAQNFVHGENYDVYSVLNLFNENESKNPTEEGRSGPQSVMMNIACGMLLYQKKYLQLRSLENAIICAEGAVLIEHQFYTSTIIAFSHLSCYEVHIASCSASKAADSIAMGIQLLRQKKESIAGLTVGIFYFAAAHLLMLFPSAVGSFLRSLLNTSNWLSDGFDHQLNSLNEKSSKKRGRVKVQNLPQSVMHALHLSEIQSLYDASLGSLGNEIIFQLMRSTLLVEGTIYGVSASPLALCPITLRAMITEISESSTTGLTSEVDDLIVEMARHASHTALAAHEGTLSLPKRPLEIIEEFLFGILDVFSYDELKVVESNILLRGVTTYLIACYLAQQGYIASSYDILEDLAATIYFHSRIDVSHGNENSGYSFRKEDVDRLACFYIKENDKLYYWPPDILLLFSYVQMKRAELACYLGFIDDLQSQKEALNTICTMSSFVFGVLGSQYIQILYHQRSRHYDKVIELSSILEQSAQKIGFLPLQRKVAAVRVSAYIKKGMYRTALTALDTLHPIPHNMTVWYITVRLNIIAEIFMEINGKSKDLLMRVFNDAVEYCREKFLLSSNDEDIVKRIGVSSFCMSLSDVVCLHSSILRVDKLIHSEISERFSNVCPSKLLQKMKQRHLLRRVHKNSTHLLDSIMEVLNIDHSPH